MRALAAPFAGPFPGLTPFGETDDDALLFFGREREREVIAANLLASRLTVLYGASGVGKSSVLRAGVAHHLRSMARRNLETRGHPEFAVVVFDEWTGDPANALLAAVQDELREVFGDRAPLERAATLTDTLHDWSGRLQCELLLILDQTEEYFLYHEQEEGARTFAGELPDLVTRPGLPVSVLLAIRDDALSRLDRFKGRIPNLFANYLRLDHLDRRAGRAAIVGPIEQYNRLHDVDPPLTVEPALVETLLDETTAGRVHLGRRGRGVVRRPGARTRIEAPYLQLVLQRLWEEEHAAGSRVLRLGTLERLGGANEVVRTHLERALAPLPLEEKDVAADVFSHLVTPSGTKIAHGLHDLAEYAHVEDHRLEPIVSSLVRHRILRPVARRAEGHGADETPYEIFHDVLGDAVLAWRAAHESERRVALERAEANRRQRRILGILGVAFVAFLAMAAVAAYALDKRAQARSAAARATEQAEIAEAALVKAEEAEAEAIAAEKEAEEQRLAAEEERDATQAAKDDADAQRAIANDRAEVAVEKTQIANAALARARTDRAFAITQKEQAIRDRRRAVTATADARTKQRQALRAFQAQRRATRLARARELTARAREHLRIDPAGALQLALQAAALRPLPVTEDVLRQGIVEMRIGGIAQGGEGPLVGAAVSRDGSSFVTASEGRRGRTRVFSTQPLRRLHQVDHGSPVRAVAVSPDGRLFATGADDGTVKVWELGVSVPQATGRHSGRVRHLTFSPAGDLLVSASEDRTVRVWDPGTGLQLRRYDHPRPMRSTVFSPDGRRLVTVPLFVDRFARVYDVRGGGDPVAQLEHGGVVTDAEFAPDGSVLVTTGRRNVFVWQTSTWNLRYPPLSGHLSAVHGVGVSPDGTRAVTFDDAGLARAWRLDTGGLITMLIRHENAITSAVFAPDSRTVLTASDDLTARIWNGELSELRTSLVGHEEPVVSAAYLPEGRILTTSSDGTARIWAAASEPMLDELGAQRHAGGATAGDVSGDGRFVASGGADGNVQLWRTTGGIVRTLRHGAAVTSVRFSGDDRRVLTAGADGRAHLWRLADGAHLRTFVHGTPITDAVLDRDGRVVVTVGRSTARIWTSAGEAERVLQHENTVTSVAVDGSGTTVVTGNEDGVARMWSTRAGEPRVLRGHTGAINAIEFSPGGARIATASADATGRVWRTDNGELVRELTGHLDPLTSVAFSADGTKVIAAAENGHVRSWKARGSERPTVFRGHTSRVADARFSADGRWVVTSGPSAAGIWVASSAERIYFLRGHNAPLVTAEFASRRRIASIGTDGSARTYVCDICVPFKELRALAKKRLAEIENAR